MNVNAELEREIASVQHGSHICLVSDQAGAELPAMVPYLRGGLARGERCLALGGQRAVDEIVAALRASGVDVAAEVRRGALVLESERDAFRRLAGFDPGASVDFLRQATVQALKDGFSGLLTAADMDWALGADIASQRLIEYENLLNQMLAGSRAHVLCHYDRERFPAEIIHDVLRTHPTAVLGGLVCPNLFFEPGEMVLGKRSFVDEVEWRIAQLRRARETQRTLEEAETANRFLADATALLVSSLDQEVTLAEVARLAVPRIVDCCVIELYAAGSHDAGFATVAHVDGRRAARAKAALAADDERARVLEVLGLARLATVPMVARERTLGALTIGNTGGRALEESHRGLAEHLARRTALAVDNARLYREAREAVRARDDFLSVASHELRTPMTPLQLQLDHIAAYLARAGASADSRLAARIEMARRQTERLVRLVEELLDVSRITRGRVELHLERFDLIEVVNAVVDRLAPASQSGVTIEVHAEGTAIGRWDRRRIDQVVTSLVSNAMKYGEGKPIDIDVGLSDGTARLAVRDRGIGIAPEDAARIFDRFERAVSPRHFGGLGLGLYVARRMVEAHGGSIVVHSAPGRGATFTVVLPLRSGRDRERDHDRAKEGAYR